METVTCPTCGASFDYTEMDAREPEDDTNTQVGWLVGGRCPKCSGTVSLSFDQLQQIANALADVDEA